MMRTTSGLEFLSHMRQEDHERLSSELVLEFSTIGEVQDQSSICDALMVCVFSDSLLRILPIPIRSQTAPRPPSRQVSCTSIRTCAFLIRFSTAFRWNINYSQARLSL